MEAYVTNNGNIPEWRCANPADGAQGFHPADGAQGFHCVHNKLVHAISMRIHCKWDIPNADHPDNVPSYLLVFCQRAEDLSLELSPMEEFMADEGQVASLDMRSIMGMMLQWCFSKAWLQLLPFCTMIMSRGIQCANSSAAIVRQHCRDSAIRQSAMELCTH
eukprot:4585980-Amphidinium_carterae.6